jgi:PKD repeat protein
VAQAGGPYSGTVGTAIALSSVGSSDGDGTIVSYAWAFGDGTTGTGASASKSYGAAGTYTATLTVTDDDGATATDQATVTVTTGGGGNAPPVAQANGPYTATAGSAVTLSSAGSSDAGGSIVSYSWNLGNGQTATGAAPSVTYATAGTYTITLTVTDNGGLTATDQATITVTGAQTGGQLTWRSAFGPYDAGNDWVTLELSIDLSQDISDTPGIEAVRTFVIDSLKWDPTRFQLVSVNLGAGISGSVNQSQSATGKVSVAGSVADAFQAGNGSRILTFATLRLRPTGTSGSVGTTTTTLGPVQGPASTNFFVYNARIAVIEGSFTLP